MPVPGTYLGSYNTAGVQTGQLHVLSQAAWAIFELPGRLSLVDSACSVTVASFHAHICARPLSHNHFFFVLILVSLSAHHPFSFLQHSSPDLWPFISFNEQPAIGLRWFLVLAHTVERLLRPFSFFLGTSRLPIRGTAY